MHGRPRKAPSAEEERSSAPKASKLRSLQSQFLQFHHSKIYTKEALEVNAKLLEANPEFLTAWNYRKVAVESLLSRSESQTETEPDSINSIFSEELKVTERALAKNFKSYGAWYHRKWVLSKGHSSIDRELQLLGVFLKKDSRNFHAWNYRRFVAALKNRSDEEELQFTTDMINDNFSNYSAWHNRSVLLSRLLERRAQGFVPKEKVLIKEYDFVHQALFTDPDDQSGWFYHLWLLLQTVKVDSPLLVSTWPPHGSSIGVSAYGCLDAPFSVNTTIPLVLCFSEVVQGVNSSTVAVDSLHDDNKDLIWKPLSTDSSLSARVWVAYLNFDKLHSSQSYPIKVHIGHSSGIMSLSGLYDCQPSHFEFTAVIHPQSFMNVERQDLRLDSWENEDFHLLESCQELSQTKVFDPPQLQEDIASMAHEWNAETMANEMALFQELQSETNCKIGKLTLARLLVAYDTMMSYNRNPHTYKSIHAEEALELYNDLITLDPPHSEYYKEEYSLVLLQQMVSSPESLLRHCYCYKSPTYSGFNDASAICLRLNNLSLSRIGSVDRLLWVQMLDLSHNQLHSIDGLEAMQLLSCLNLCNNRIASFAALEPLKMLKSLKVLSISDNEIGAHSVNSRRYLCSSPLSHTGRCWNFGEFVPDTADVTNYWEAFAIFEDLKLTQLDISGNPIAGEMFYHFLFLIMPSLKWLDSLVRH